MKKSKSFERLRATTQLGISSLSLAIAAGAGAFTPLTTVSRSVNHATKSVQANWYVGRNLPKPSATYIAFATGSSSTTIACAFQTTAGGYHYSNSALAPAAGIHTHGLFLKACGDGATAYGIMADRLITDANDYYGGDYMLLNVNGTWFDSPSATVDMSDGQVSVVAEQTTLSDLQVDVNYRFFGANDTDGGAKNRAAVRALFSFTNDSNVDVVDVPIVIYNYFFGIPDLKADTLTSDGDSSLEASDYWVSGSYQTASPLLLEDNIFILSRYGAGASVVPSGKLGHLLNTNFYINYTLTVAANSTVRVLHYLERAPDFSTRDTHVPAYESMNTLFDAGLLTGLSSQEVMEVVNYNADIDGDGYDIFSDAYPDDASRFVDASKNITAGNTSWFFVLALWMLVGVRHKS